MVRTCKRVAIAMMLLHSYCKVSIYFILIILYIDLDVYFEIAITSNMDFSLFRMNPL